MTTATKLGLTTKQNQSFELIAPKAYKKALLIFDQLGEDKMAQDLIRGAFHNHMNNGLTVDSIKKHIRNTDAQIKIGEETHGDLSESGWLVLETPEKTYEMQVRGGSVVNSNVGDFDLSDKKHGVITADDRVATLFQLLGIV